MELEFETMESRQTDFRIKIAWFSVILNQCFSETPQNLFSTASTQLGPERATSAAMQGHDPLFPQPLLAGAQQPSRLKAKASK
jgi:hypothetical protein